LQGKVVRLSDHLALSAIPAIASARASAIARARARTRTRARAKGTERDCHSEQCACVGMLSVYFNRDCRWKKARGVQETSSTAHASVVCNDVDETVLHSSLCSRLCYCWCLEGDFTDLDCCGKESKILLFDGDCSNCRPSSSTFFVSSVICFCCSASSLL
jgi:hypothetical protein